MIRVLIVDDSPMFASALALSLSADPELVVIGVAANGEEAVAQAAALQPDLITMDVQMPVMDGLTAIEAIMASRPTPILVVTGDPGGASGALALEALRRGALEVMAKPTAWPGTPEEQARLREQVKLLAGIPVIHHPLGRLRRTPLPVTLAPRGAAGRDATAAELPPRRPTAVALVASTGGPSALTTVLANLTPDLPFGLLVVQHLPAGLAANLARWLAEAGPLPAQVAADGQACTPGTVLVAPDGVHLELDGAARVRLRRGAEIAGHRPSGTLLLQSLAQHLGPRGLGAVLTGMGDDGAEGLLALRRAGGITAAQSQASCVVFGMPQAAIALGAAQHVVDPLGLAQLLRQAAHLPA